MDGENARWLDRASGAVESRLNQLGTRYLRTLVSSFEERGRQAEAARAEAEAKAKTEPKAEAKAEPKTEPGQPPDPTPPPPAKP